MNYSFPRYLLSKQTVDDRALNKDVVQALRQNVPPGPVTVIEVGAGIGTMLKRLVEWNLFSRGEYTLVDSMEENFTFARDWIPHWAREAGFSVERNGPDQLRLCDRSRDISILFVCSNVFDFIPQVTRPADVLIAHAFLDLLPMPESLERMLPLTDGLAWLTINFDGLSSFLPVVEPVLDEQIERLYHATMDRRSTGGDSRMGRKMFEQLPALNVGLLAAGPSDWVVYARDGIYPADEKYFLQFILHFFESSLKECNELDTATRIHWLHKRREQIECGELVYVAHQMDFLVRRKT